MGAFVGVGEDKRDFVARGLRVRAQQLGKGGDVVFGAQVEREADGKARASFVEPMDACLFLLFAADVGNIDAQAAIGVEAVFAHGAVANQDLVGFQRFFGDAVQQIAADDDFLLGGVVFQQQGNHFAVFGHDAADGCGKACQPLCAVFGFQAA